MYTEIAHVRHRAPARAAFLIPYAFLLHLHLPTYLSTSSSTYPAPALHLHLPCTCLAPSPALPDPLDLDLDLDLDFLGHGNPSLEGPAGFLSNSLYGLSGPWGASGSSEMTSKITLNFEVHS